MRLLDLQLYKNDTMEYSRQSMSTMTDMSEFTSEFFDAASAAWMANKIRRGPSLAYRCEATKKDGAQCTRPAVSRASIVVAATHHHLCVQHRRYSPPSNTSAHGKSARSSDSA
jgi:hypothetical protein